MSDKSGHTAIAVANGNEALHALRSAPYDLVFIDCPMPQLDGYEATKRIRSSQTLSYRGIPIIAMTANAMNGDREKCLAAGMDDYISKPMRQGDLLVVIDRAILGSAKSA